MPYASIDLNGEDALKLVRFGAYGGEKPGLIDEDGYLRDISHLITNLSGATLSADMLDMIRKLEVEMLPKIEGSVRYGACIGAVRNFIGVSRNYASTPEDKIANEEMKNEAAKTSSAPSLPDPILFNKAPSCIVGAHDPVMLPKGSSKIDWGVELAVIMGRRGAHIRADQAYDYIAGYCICNDLTDRVEQYEGTGQLVKAKSAPTFGPLGPWLVTTDEILDPHALSMWVELNGKRVQTGTTAGMLHRVPELISYVSRFMALEPGDVITTGSPFGSGHEMEPPAYLKKGDRLKLGIDGLGAQEQKILAWID
jgi:2-keto-4-pentenoate hydratase/2-oxohepta-3-ene-1,7-dioic acid hydratase in catechol pathway